eukprot:6433760-Pyramimonas_sp.AAC.1
MGLARIGACAYFSFLEIAPHAEDRENRDGHAPIRCQRGLELGAKLGDDGPGAATKHHAVNSRS